MNLTKSNNQAMQELKEKFEKAHSGFRFPNILVMGQSGAGKTRSICNLDPKKTLVIVTEKSTLTFPKAKAFYEANNVRDVKDYRKIMSCIYHESMRPEIECIVIDSFTGMWKSALKLAQSEAQGFQVWDRFAGYVQDFLDLIGEVKQPCVVIAHSEKVGANDLDSEYENEVVIEGKKIKKLPISSNFEITLFSKKDYETEDNVRYVFYTNALRHTPAKSPEGMLDRVIPNDINSVIEAIQKYYK